MFLAIIFNFFVIPIELSFKIQFVVDFGENYFMINYALNICFFLDILIKCNTPFYCSGRLEKSRIKIMKRYIKSRFFYDAISIAPKFAIDNIAGDSLVSLLFFFRYYQYKQFIETLERIFDIDETYEVFLSMFDLLLKVIFFSHCIACAWHAIAFFNYSGSKTWLDYGNLRDAQWLEKYLNSAYWIVACMVTCGFGEKVSPQTNTELFCGIWFILGGSGVLGYTISTIGTAVNLLSERKNQFK